MIEPLSPPDPLSSAMLKMRVQSLYSGMLDAAGDWALEVPGHSGFKLHLLLKGAVWIEMNRSGTRHHLRAGDCMLVTSGEPLVVATDLAIPRRLPLEAALGTVRDGVFTINGGGDCQTTTVLFQFEGHLPKVVFGGLPPAIHVAAADAGAAGLQWYVERMRAEFLGRGAGRSLMLDHLAPMILVQVLRTHLASAAARAGWLTTLSDPRLCKAMDAIHRDCGRAWTLEALADLSGLCRAAFALNFRRRVGMTPGAYLTHWRMQSACDLLRGREELGIGTIARRVGYESESAFSNAFNRVVGCRPGSYRRTAGG